MVLLVALGPFSNIMLEAEILSYIKSILDPPIWQIVGQNQKNSLHLDLRINPLSHDDYLPASISSIANLEAIELYLKIR